jgi:hypothetical protein
MGIKGEEVQAKGIIEIFSLIENFPYLDKRCPFRYRKPPGRQKDITKRISP